MAGEERNGLHLSGIVIAVLVLATWMFNRPQLVGERPEQGNTPGYESGLLLDVPARLWQDPLAAVIRFRATAAQGQSPDTLPPDKAHAPARFHHVISELASGSGVPVTVLGVTLSGSVAAEARESRIRTRTAVLAGLATSGFVPEMGDYIGYIAMPVRGPCDPPTGECDSAPLILPFEILFKTGFKEQGTEGGVDKQPVVLLWIPEEMLLQQPIARLSYIRKTILESLRPIEAVFGSVVGPQWSDTLGALYREACLSNGEKDAPEITFFSATATAPDLYLLPEKPLNGKLCDLEQALQRNNLVVDRSILTDDRLIEVLVRELALRSADPACADNTGLYPPHPRCVDSAQAGNRYQGHRNHVVLLSEWDTAFGRTLPRLFEESVREKVYRLEEPASLSGILKREQELAVPWVHRFGYLRGLDGDIAREGGAKIEESDRKSLVKVAQTEGLTQLEPAVGTSQFDYLRRLIQRIKRLDQQLQERGQGSIRAFGILGNDVYDKLLILQALKDEFPHHIFFTTDLDARYLSPRHYKWTRNLIVAASFGLQLSPHLQAMVPPFRSSYQTSLYLAVKMALGSQIGCGSAGNTSACLTPQLFEVGRGDFVRLRGDKAGTTQAQQRISKDLDIYQDEEPAVDILLSFEIFQAVAVAVVGGFGIVLLALLAAPMRQLYRRVREFLGLWVHPLRNWAKILSHQVWLVIISLLLLGGAYAWMTGTSRLEPFEWTKGVSIWPSELIRLGAAVLSWVFLFRAWGELKNVDEELEEKFKLGKFGQPKEGGWLCRLSRLWRFYRRRRCKGVLRYFRLKGFYRWYDTSRKKEQHQLLGEQMLRLPSVAEGKRPARSVWTEYRRYSGWGARVGRTIIAFLLFWTIAWVALFGFQDLMGPQRGLDAYYFSLLNGMVFLGIPFLLLLFFVVDETRLCTGLTRNLCGEGICWPRSPDMPDADEVSVGRKPALFSHDFPHCTGWIRNLCFEGIQLPQCSITPSTEKTPETAETNIFVDDFLTIEFIAWRTQPAGDIVWYPLIILILILISMSTRFDNYATPGVVLGLIGVSLAIALSSTMLLRQSARNAKEVIVDSLKAREARRREEASRDEPTHIELIIQRIDKVHGGAFRAWYNDPVTRSLAWVLSMATVIITEYLTVSG